MLGSAKRRKVQIRYVGLPPHNQRRAGTQKSVRRTALRRVNGRQRRCGVQEEGEADVVDSAAVGDVGGGRWLRIYLEEEAGRKKKGAGSRKQEIIGRKVHGTHRSWAWACLALPRLASPPFASLRWLGRLLALFEHL